MPKVRIAALAALVLVTACEGLKEAMTAHVDVAARAERQELSVQRLSEWMGNSQIPLSKQVAEQVASVWVSYQLLGKAAAAGDSLVDTVLIDKVMWPVFSQSKSQKWMQQVRERLAVDTSNLEAAYNSGRLLSAKHILFQVPAGQATTGSDSVMRRAEAIRRQATTANFAGLARQHGSDGTKDTGGDLGVFPPQAMVAQFSAAVAALKPGEIGPLVRTEFGYHIVRRNTYQEAKAQFDPQYAMMQRTTAESTYFAGIERARKVEVKPNAAKVVKDVVADLEANKGNRTAVGSYSGGNFTGGDVARWLGSMPNQQRDQMRGQIEQAPDSLLVPFVRSLMLNELVLEQADSAGITLDTAEVNAVRNAFKGLVQNVWAGLRISPALLADSAKTPADRERLAASRIDAYMGRLLQGQEGYVDVPPPLADALREKYDGSLKQSGLTRALEMAQKARTTADSARAASQPKSAVPMPPADTSAGAKK